MEEILASIRQMIPEEEPPGADEPAPAQPPETAPEPPRQRALLLTRMVAEDGSIVRLDPFVAAPAALPAPAPSQAAEPLLLANPLPPLLPAGPGTAGEEMAPPASPPPDRAPRVTADVPADPAPPAGSPAGETPTQPAGSPAGETMEAFLARILEPHLKAWLNEHLPPMVERMVQKVIDDVRREVDAKDDTP